MTPSLLQNLSYTTLVLDFAPDDTHLSKDLTGHPRHQNQDKKPPYPEFHKSPPSTTTIIA